MSGLGWRHDTATFHPDSRFLLDFDSQVYGSTVLPGYTPYGSFPTFDHFGNNYVHAGAEDWSRSTAYPLIWRKAGASNQGLGPAWEKASDIPGWAPQDSVGVGPGNATAWPASELRFPNIYSIPASEFTISQTLSHTVFTYAGLLGGYTRYAPQPPPAVRLQLKAGTQVRLGDTVRLAVETSPSTVQVDYYCGWHYLGSSTAAKDGFALSWKTGLFKVQPGAHRITARAYAGNGQSSVPEKTAEADIVVVAK
jgi:hypothetical protein